MKPTKVNAEVLVEIAAEGGNLTIIGERMNRTWHFKLLVNDCSAELLHEDEAALSSEIAPQSWVSSWEEAVALLDQYPWVRLHPLKVHPEFRARIWREVSRRIGHSRNALWREICNIN